MPLLGKLANWCGGSRRVFVKQLWSFTKRGNDPKLTGHLNLISFTCPAKVKHTKRAHGTNPQVTVAQSSLSPKWMNVVYPTINLPKCPIFQMLGVLPRKYVYYEFYLVLSHVRSLNNQPLLSPGCFDLATAGLQLRVYLHASPPGPNLRPSQVASPRVDLGEGKTHGLLLLIYMGKDERHLQTNHIHGCWRCSSHRNAGDSRWRWELKLRNTTLKKSRTRSCKIFWLLADVFLQTCWLLMRIWQTCWVIWFCLCFAPHSHRKGNKLGGKVNLVWNIRHLQVSFPWILLFIHHPPIFQTVRATTTINITQQCGQVSHPQASGFQTGYMMHHIHVFFQKCPEEGSVHFARLPPVVPRKDPGWFQEIQFQVARVFSATSWRTWQLGDEEEPPVFGMFWWVGVQRDPKAHGFNWFKTFSGYNMRSSKMQTYEAKKHKKLEV